ncbi:ATP-binding protein [Vibrio sp. 10N.261.51.F12]|uniref:ATP-binding protein n=1 Tax=Vibrio sp. 10N.261.51.F12 TaxID=3229679 RepID=UPI00355240DD
MRLTIFSKLFISILFGSLFMVVGMSLMINYSFKSGLQSYINDTEQEKAVVLASDIIQYYDLEDGWNDLASDPFLWHEIFTSWGEPIPRPRPFMVFDDHRPRKTTNKSGPLSHRIYLTDQDHRWVIGIEPPLESNKTPIAAIPLVVSGNIVGWLNIIQPNTINDQLVKSFYAQQMQNMAWIISLAGLGSFLIAIWLVRHFLMPLKQLNQTAVALTKGDYSHQIPTHGHDEFSKLSRAFNSLTTSLSEQKKTREQWITDISHELRTPLSVLQGELEAIQDGIRQPEPKHIDSMHHQVHILGKLVEDLYQLSLSDSGAFHMKFANTNLTNLIDMQARNFEYRIADKGLTLIRQYDAQQPLFVWGDDKSLSQLIGNLLENSFRYTDANGQIQISLHDMTDHIELHIEDSAPTVDVESLPRLFDRLYRIDKSRSRQYGGAGLGLSICASIVNMHEGQIQAQPSELGGIIVTVSFNKQKSDKYE